MFLSTLIMCAILASECSGAEFRIKNNRGDTFWIGIQGGANKPALEGGGFVLDGNKERMIHSPDDWEGRFWARTGCNSVSNHCQTGDCGSRLQCDGNGGDPPATLVEIRLKGYQGMDFYDISLVDGFNVFATIQPVDGEGDCPTLGCTGDINGECPNELRQEVDGTTVGCKSSCQVFQTDQYCCRNNYDTAETCNINDWPVNYAQYFKAKCPDAYSYVYDDSSSLKTCIASRYLITFG